MNPSPQILRRISALPKAVVAEVLSIVADIFEGFDTQKNAKLRDFDAQENAKVDDFCAKNDQKNANSDAQNHAKEGERGCLSSLTSFESRGLEEKENIALLGKPSTRKPCAREGLAELQEEFWKLYPKRVNKRTAFSRLEFLHRKGIEKTRIIDGVKRYANATKNTEKRYIKSPDVWLNKGCFDDEDFPVASGRDGGVMGAIKNFLGDDDANGRRCEESSRQTVSGIPFSGNGRDE